MQTGIIILTGKSIYSGLCALSLAFELSVNWVCFRLCLKQSFNRQVKHDVYGKRQTAKIELLVSDFSRLYNLGKLFAFTVIKGFFPYFSTVFI